MEDGADEGVIVAAVDRVIDHLLALQFRRVSWIAIIVLNQDVFLQRLCAFLERIGDDLLLRGRYLRK